MLGQPYTWTIRIRYLITGYQSHNRLFRYCIRFNQLEENHMSQSIWSRNGKSWASYLDLTETDKQTDLDEHWCFLNLLPWARTSWISSAVPSNSHLVAGCSAGAASIRLTEENNQQINLSIFRTVFSLWIWIRIRFIMPFGSNHRYEYVCTKDCHTIGEKIKKH